MNVPLQQLMDFVKVAMKRSKPVPRANLVYSALILLNDQNIGELLKILFLKNDLEISATVNRITDTAVKINEVWRTLPVVTAAATHALVRQPARKDDQLSSLRITSAQRKAITDGLLKTFW
jgi:hypothetical protein